MMWWYGNGVSGWGMALMIIGTVLLWVVIILGVVALMRHLTAGSRTTEHRPTPERLLAERFARGEIDEQEYHQRLDTLGQRYRTHVEP